MNKEYFEQRKADLITLLTDELENEKYSISRRESLMDLLELLNQYVYENRLEKKGLLAHTIVDSLDLDYSIGEKFIYFDNTIK